MPEKSKPKTFGWPFWLGIVGIIFFFATLTTPTVIRCKKKSKQGEAITNLGLLYYPLIAFDEEYGSFPNDETAAFIKQNIPSSIDLTGTSSNAFFRQLFAAQLLESEQIFYANVSGSKKPDGDISPGHLLEKGEVAFAYVAGLSTAGNSSRPIVLLPIVPGTKKFDPKPFNGKAIVLRVDKSVAVMNISKDGEILLSDGVKLLDPNNELWNGKIPDIRYPDL